MINAGLSDGDLIVIDRSLDPEHNKIAVCFIDGDFTVKRIIKKGMDLYLKPENKNYKPIKIDVENQLQIWGIVTYVIKSLWHFWFKKFKVKENHVGKNNRNSYSNINPFK